MESILYDSLHLIHDAELLRPDLTDVPLQNPDLELFTVGSFYLHEGTQVTGAAFTSLYEIVWVSPPSPSHNA